MKPRNEFERELQRVIDKGKLTPVTPKQMEQARIVMDEDKKRRLFLFNTEQTINGMKLTKCYKVHRIGRGSMFTYFHLVLIRAERDGKVIWAGRQTNMGVLDSFSHIGNISIKNQKYWYEWYVEGNNVLRSIGKPYQYSVTRHFEDNDYEWRDSRMETLSKNHEVDLMTEIMLNRRPLTDHIWSAYKVAKRHQYHFNGELWKWLGYVEMLRLNGKDYHNPVVVCPANLSDAYHRIVDINDKRLRNLKRKREAEEEEKKLKEALLFEQQYQKDHKKWLGVVIIGRGITIKPLQSVKEFKEEAEAMHHCVYTNAYYKKKDSLIMSAKDKQGNRLATIEYDLKRNSILQCRAACNEQPKRYKEICKLISKYDFRKNKTLQPCKQ